MEIKQQGLGAPAAKGETELAERPQQNGAKKEGVQENGSQRSAVQEGGAWESGHKAQEDGEPPLQSIEDIEIHFERLSSIADRVSLMNSEYEAVLEPAFQEMEAFAADAYCWDLDSMPPEVRQFYLSCLSFHREVVAEILAEARRLLMENRRIYLKRLAHYHKQLRQWLQEAEDLYPL